MKLIIKNFFSTIRRYKTSSFLNVIGLAVAFSSLYIILVQVAYDFTFNSKIKDVDRVYRLETAGWENPSRFNTWLNRPDTERMISSIPQIELGGTAFVNGEPIFFTLDRNGSKAEYSIIASELSMPILDIFGFEAVSGNLKDLGNPQNVIISESAAKRLNLGVGDFMEFPKVSDELNMVTIAAIYKDFAPNVDWSGVELFHNIGKRSLDDASEWGFNYYIKLNQANDTANFNQQMRNYVREQIIAEGNLMAGSEEFNYAIKRKSLRLNPIKNTYFSTDVENAPGKIGNRTTTYTLLGIAILIVIIALVNFINFFFALVPIRIKSVNTHKIFGSKQSTIRFNFIFEAMGLTIFALILAWVLVLIIQSSSIVNLISAAIGFTYNWPIVAITIVAAYAIALIGSIYPAYYITSFPPAMVIKGSFGSTKAGQRLRYALIGLQFTISIALIICASFIKLQHSYMMKYEMGFNRENLLTATIPSNANKISQDLDIRDAFTSNLLQNSQITDVAWAAGRFIKPVRMGWGRKFKDRNINFQCYPVSWNFLQFMGIHIEEGRDFSNADERKDDGTIIFNQSAKKEFNLTLTDKISGHKSDSEIAGFCSDFNFKPLQYGISPMAFYVFGNDPWWRPGLLYIRTSAGANIQNVISHVKETVLEFAQDTDPNKINVIFFDEELQQNYETEKRLTTLITLFTLVSVIISLMGVFGLVTFETRYRRKEIGVRRVHGANIGEILTMFNIKFVRIIIICFVIAAPISYLIIDHWLESFSYRTSMYWWVFAISLLIILAITITTVTIRSLHAATDNPSNSIATE